MALLPGLTTRFTIQHVQLFHCLRREHLELIGLGIGDGIPTFGSGGPCVGEMTDEPKSGSEGRPTCLYFLWAAHDISRTCVVM